jgi:hypothetical protein
MNEQYRGENPTEVFTLADRQRDEGGFIELSRLNIKRWAIVGAAGGLALGLVQGLFGSPIEVETDVSFSGGLGSLEKVEATLDPDCMWQFENKNDGASAGFSAHVKVPKQLGPLGSLVSKATTLEMSETFHGHLTNRVCNKESAITGVYDPKLKKFTLTLSAEEPFTDYVYRTNPFSDEFDHDNNAQAALIESVGPIINALPEFGSIKPSGNLGNDLSNYLQGGALIMAYENSAHACGNLAWDHAKPLYEEAIINRYLTPLKLAFPKVHFTKDNFEVILPDDVEFVSQNEGVYDALRTHKDTNNLKFHVKKINKKDCKDMPVDKAGVPNG